MNLLLAFALQTWGVPDYDNLGRHHFVIPAIPENVALIDLPGFSCCSRVEVRQGELVLPMLDGDLSIPFGGESILWTVADIDQDQKDDFLVLVDGQRLERLTMTKDAKSFAWELVLDGLGGRNGVPRGLRSATFVRDLDKNGKLDILVPVGERIEIWFGDDAAEYGFRKGPILQVASFLELKAGALKPNSLVGQVHRSLRIPAIEMNDISGDDLPDLLVNHDGKVSQYISDANGLPSVPTATVDMAKFDERLPEIKFDPGNIAGISKYVVQQEWDDLNLDGALDLVVFAGGLIIVYLGGDDGLDLRRPRDQMQTRGNVLYATAIPVDDDEIPDLVLLRVEDISLARLLSFVFMDVKIQFDILAYKGRGDGRFQKRPMEQSKEMKLQIPSLMNLADGKDDAEEVRHSVHRTADFDGDGLNNDMVVMGPFGGVQAWKNVVESAEAIEKIEDQVLSRALAAPKEVALDVETIGKWAMGRTSLLASLVDGKPSLAKLPAPNPHDELPQILAVKDFDGDGIDEVMILRRPSKNSSSLNGIIWDPFPN